ncbi:small ribosomal subunit protein uS17m-like [Lineus longissimus]|uniref:small ribosomal subunit protein uS17m-like n=1 Tax=Lineus longissimus TaxID=88925 RepID=UPI002B4D72D8
MPIKLPKSKSILLVGQVLKHIGQENKRTIKVRTISMVLDDYLKMYFNKRSHFWADDIKEECEPGDLVLIKQLSEPIRAGVTHEVGEVVFQLGRRMDPLTGMRIYGGVYSQDDLPNPHETLKKHNVPIPDWAKNLTEIL